MGQRFAAKHFWATEGLICREYRAVSYKYLSGVDRGPHFSTGVNLFPLPVL